MADRRRRRIRARDIAGQPKSPLPQLIGILVALAVVIGFMTVVGEQGAAVFEMLVGSPEAELPAPPEAGPAVLDAGPADAAGGAMNGAGSGHREP